MNKDTKGFTLIELLATIIVLAVVSLIAVPIVVSIIDNARTGAFKRSAESINKISSNYYTEKSYKIKELGQMKFDCNNDECESIITNENGDIEKYNLKATGSMGNGYVKIYNNGNVEFLLSNGRLCAAKYPDKDNIEYYKGTCKEILIDSDKIIINSINTVSTTSSITVYGDVTVGQSGVGKYEYYIDDKLAFTEISEDPTSTDYKYTFKEVTGKSHKIKVIVYNGTYNKPNYDESIGMDEKEIEASLLDFGTITIAPSSTDWKTSKTYTITSTDKEAKIQYKLELGDELKQDWVDYSSEITVNWQSTTLIPTNICARLNDGKNTSEEICFTETKIDTTAPSVPTIMKGVYEDWTVIDDLTTWHNKTVYFPQTGKNGEVLVSGSEDNESGIARYEISSDNKTWYDLSKYNPTGVYNTAISAKRYYRAVNNVGLASPSREVDIKIDTIKPTITYNYNAVSDQGGYGGAYYMGCFNGEITPTLTLSDTGGSGLSDNNQILVWKDDTWPNNAVSIGNNQWNIPMTTEGRYIPHVIARDNAGNVSQGTRPDTDANHLTVWDIDTSTPTMSVNLNGYTPGSWTNGSVAIALIGSNGGCDTGKYYWYSINDGDWVHFGTGDVATYNITNDANYNIKFLITDGFGRWGTQTQNYSIKTDKTAPTYTSVEVKNVTSSGYDIYMYGVNDTLSGVNRVQFPTWIDGQAVRDGWDTGSFASGINEGNGTWHYRVNTSDYNNQSGTYITHIYLWDNVGNVSALNTNTANNVVNVPSACNKDDNGNCITNTTYKTGDAITLGGYNWHVIGDTGTNLTLLMDADMGGSHNSSGSAYSWDTSTIRTNLNGTFLTDLESKITNEIVSTPICADPSRIGRETFGGYLMSEIAALTPTFDIYGNLITRCTQVVTDKVRLITISEYWHMSPYYTSVESNYPNVENITRISRNSDYASWLYCNSSTCGSSNGWWWTMGSSNNNSSSRYAYYVHNYGVLYTSAASSNMGVRPVITIVK